MWITAEAGVVRELRRYILDELGVDRDDVHASAYWKAGRTSDSRDEEMLTGYRQAVREGLDTCGPEVITEIELSLKMVALHVLAVLDR